MDMENFNKVKSILIGGGNDYNLEINNKDINMEYPITF
jgi:hypothetical protein